MTSAENWTTCRLGRHQGKHAANQRPYATKHGSTSSLLEIYAYSACQYGSRSTKQKEGRNLKMFRQMHNSY
ncbi:hypothetical protein SMMN14_08264 [Sphaerulina musiva]